MERERYTFGTSRTAPNPADTCCPSTMTPVRMRRSRVDGPPACHREVVPRRCPGRGSATSSPLENHPEQQKNEMGNEEGSGERWEGTLMEGEICLGADPRRRRSISKYFLNLNDGINRVNYMEVSDKYNIFEIKYK